MIVFHSGTNHISEIAAEYFQEMHIMTSYFASSNGSEPKMLKELYKINQGKMKKRKKKKNHPIPKEEQILQTAANQMYMVECFLNGKAFNIITKGVGQKTKRERGKHKKEGRAVEAKVFKLFAGKTWFSEEGIYRLEIPKFAQMHDRTGKRPLHRNEVRCFKQAIKYKLPIHRIHQLTGRDEEDINSVINEILGRNKNTLFS